MSISNLEMGTWETKNIKSQHYYDYACSVCYLNLTQELKNKLQVMQNKYKTQRQISKKMYLKVLLRY